MTRDDEDRGFLGRWSARKRAAKDAPERPAGERERIEPPVETPPSVSEEEAAELSDAEICARLKLPDPASLEHGADFRAFLQGGVPKRLQRLALRRLWAVSPGGAALDGLVDYAEDYTDAAVAVAHLSTTYEVGRGLKAHVDALAAETAPAETAPAELEDAAGETAQAAEDKAASDGEESLDAGESAVAERALEDNSDSLNQEINPEPVREFSPPSEMPHRKKPRRMAFRFEND
jgi:hypothetical protein